MGTFVVPFNEIDEACFSACAADRPFNIEAEIECSGRLDIRRLRRAVSVAARSHPLARARLAQSGAFDRRNHWQIVDRLELDPLIVLEEGRSASKISSDLLEQLVPLESAPPFRLVLTRSDRGDRLTLIMSHVASDGIGSLRLLRSIALAYAKEPDRVPDVGLLEARALDRHFARPGSPAWNRRMQSVGRAQLDAWLSPASRVAGLVEFSTPGIAVHHVRIPKQVTTRLCEQRGPATVNDQLLIALTRTIEAWNARSGRPTDRISFVVPLNLRPHSWRREVVANLSLATVVTTGAAERDEDDGLARAIVAQTAGAKEDRAAAGFADLYRLGTAAPNFWRRALSSFLGATAAPRMMPTAVLSNVGEVEDSLSFGPAGPATHLWFSPPCPMRGCLAVGAVTYAGQLFLSLRCSPALRSSQAAAAFGTLLCEALASIAAGGRVLHRAQNGRRRAASRLRVG